MGPTKARVIDDVRSETPLSTSKDRLTTTSTTSKSKKANASSSNGTSVHLKAAVGATNSNVTATTSNGPVDSDQELPHIDWTTFPTHSLHNYRSAYRLQIPSAYTQSHAELLYKSCDLALRAPSQVLARKTARDLKLFKQKQSQPTSTSRIHTNGVLKPGKASRPKDKRINAKEDINGPLSPNSHPSYQDSTSNPPDNTSMNSPALSTDEHTERQANNSDEIPQSLNQNDPNSTVIGILSPNSLSGIIRKHFNAQQLNEAETIARFTYVARQHAPPTTSRVQPLSQRLNTLPLPPTTAENIAAIAEAAARVTTLATVLPSAIPSASIPSSTAVQTKTNAHTAHSLSAPRTLGGQQIEVEGSYGDGKGWIMGTTSCGREVRKQDGGGGTGTFRLRFRP